MSERYFGHQGPAVGNRTSGLTPATIDAIHQCLVACDSELSAQSHGRPASSDEELKILSSRCRRLCDELKKARQ